ncbi:unnamed protein product [Lactuca saligna]|uniref:Uncharacterized protein n=1 Tax=Lactuca saligna TaxID=75948 RepID=A0AA36A2L4_LACSI|nr:unnamed protein product [Lactuca saligna]
MVGAEIEGSTSTNNAYVNGLVQINNGSLEEKLDELRNVLGKTDDDPLRIVSVGAGAWSDRSVDRATSQHLFDVINTREDVLRLLIRGCAYLKYVEARLGDLVLYVDEILKHGFCLNMIHTPLSPLKVVTNLREAVWDADIVINGLPSVETHQVFQEISKYRKERITVPITRLLPQFEADNDEPNAPKGVRWKSKPSSLRNRQPLLEPFRFLLMYALFSSK